MPLKKKHCTTNEAIQVGINMKAEHILLTHFSQRYPKIPTIDKILHEEITAPAIAFDLMSVTDKQLKLLPLMLDTLRLFFSELEKDEEPEEE